MRVGIVQGDSARRAVVTRQRLVPNRSGLSRRRAIGERLGVIRRAADRREHGSASGVFEPPQFGDR